MSQCDLAKAANVSLTTITNFENRRSVPIAKNLLAIQAALEERGISFVFGVDDSPLGIMFRLREKDVVASTPVQLTSDVRHHSARGGSRSDGEMGRRSC
jgi:transcriptional regulator with XRE-family HTH domain